MKKHHQNHIMFILLGLITSLFTACSNTNPNGEIRDTLLNEEPGQTVSPYSSGISTVTSYSTSTYTNVGTSVAVGTNTVSSVNTIPSNGSTSSNVIPSANPLNSQYTNPTGWPFNCSSFSAPVPFTSTSTSTGVSSGSIPSIAAPSCANGPYPDNYQTQNYGGFPNYQAGYGGYYYPAAVTALYRGILGRNPDLPGLEFWLREIMAGRPYTNVVNAFVQSPEALTHGNLNDFMDVTAIFRTVFGGMPVDSSILNAEASALAANQITLPALFQQWLSTSGRYQVYGRPIVDLYKRFLGRNPDYQGLSNYVGALESGVAYTDLMTSFQSSSEATSLGGILAENCINAYRVVMGRLPERFEIQQCVSMGDNSAVNQASPYSPVLQQYIQQLMYGGYGPVSPGVCTLMCAPSDPNCCAH